ncbi:MAG: tRNA 2-thiouridine(34) synthase MnmA [Burkholderiales bacterium]|nr:tRNA 2-thiouridine(34) synthase MnmA [Burkholderiales bacterium]
MTKVIVGLSGGVDSSVAAYLLKQQGYDVIGVFMQNWEDDNDDEYCSIKQDSIDAIAVADKLNIDIEIVNFAKQYKDNVFNYFLNEYSNGRTPNPDILCNSEIKFKAFLNYAIEHGADFIATGHYVGKTNIDNAFSLTKALDLKKDQSYFLYRLNQYQISKSLFPLASITKPEVRKIAAKLNLATANKKDSTGICFIGERPFREFLQKYLPNKPGNIVTNDGKIVGQHLGLMYYTLGQRKGLGIGGLGEPWFVVDKNLTTNELVVVQGHNNNQLFKTKLTASDLAFALNNKIKPGKYSAKTRYRMQDAKCEVTYINDDTLELTFEVPQWAVTPGQSVVIYDNDLCLGGGIIN